MSGYAFHLSNNLWAGVVAGFVYLVALALTQQRLTAMAAAVLFVVHPVHRYLFLPSVGAVILIAWLVFKATDHLPKWNVAAATALVAVVSLIWLKKTTDYLSEWQDPRSV